MTAPHHPTTRAPAPDLVLSRTFLIFVGPEAAADIMGDLQQGLGEE